MSLRFARCVVFIVMSTTGVLAQPNVPDLQGRRVHDEAGVLSGGTVEYLEQELKLFEDSTTNQIAILIVPSLEGEGIETFSLRVVEAWKLGTKANDNGILLIVAIRDHKMRIETGQGLEGVLPDAICNRIIRNEMAPRFRNNDYDGGVMAAITAIEQAIKGEYHADEPPVRRRNSKGNFWLILAIVVILIFRFISRNRGGGGRGISSAAPWIFLGSGRSWGGGGGGGGFLGGGGSFGGGGSSGSW